MSEYRISSSSTVRVVHDYLSLLPMNNICFDFSRNDRLRMNIRCESFTLSIRERGKLTSYT